MKSPIQQEDVLFEQVTSAWQDFCTQVLKFEIPEDLLYAYAEQKIDSAS